MKNIHVLPTDKPSVLKQNNITKKISLVKNKGIDLTAYAPINIYITNDEEIKDGDWYISILENEVYKATKETQNIMSVANLIGTTTYKNTHFKIILTTDQDLIKDGVQAIDDEFLEWFVKNPSCEEVEVTYGVLKPFQSENKGYLIHCPDNEVLEEPKQETLEEAGVIAAGLCEHLEAREQAFFIAGFQERIKWQQERMYSDEEVLDILFSMSVDNPNDITKWFEQFKKKIRYEKHFN